MSESQRINSKQSGAPGSLCVLQVLPALVTGGVERGTVDIAKALTKSGHRSLVVSSGGPMVESLNSTGTIHLEHPLHTKNPVLIRKNAVVLSEIIKAYNVDIVHARSRAPAWSAYWASKATNIPFITTFHGTYGHKSAIKRWYNKIMLKGEATIAVSEFIKQHILSVYPDIAKELIVIPRGIDTLRFNSEYCPTNEIDQLRNQWNIKPAERVIMLPGRLTRWKGQIEFIKAAAKLLNNQTDQANQLLRFLIVGDEQGRTGYKQELERLIQDKGMEQHISLVGSCHDMTVAYALSDIIVSASNEPEAFGRVACEAQAMGKLVVATKHGGANETIAPAQRQLFCEANNCLSLTKAIEKALHISESEKAIIASASETHIRQHFSLDQMTQQTLDLYSKLHGSISNTARIGNHYTKG